MSLDDEEFSIRGYLKAATGTLAASTLGLFYRPNDYVGDFHQNEAKDCLEYSVSCPQQPREFSELDLKNSSSRSNELNESMLENNR